MFSFCVTPKRFLHDLLANHQDAQSSASLPVQQFAASGYHCHIDDLVVEAPFIPDVQIAISVFNPSSPIVYSEPIGHFVFAYGSHTDSRGPPASFCS